MTVLIFLTFATVGVAMLLGAVLFLAPLLVLIVQTFFPMPAERNSAMMRQLLEDDERHVAGRQERAEAFVELLNRHRL